MKVSTRIAAKALRLWCGLALAFAMAPSPAWAADEAVTDGAAQASTEAAPTTTDGKPAYIEGEMLVVYNEDVSAARAMGALERIEGVDEDESVTGEALSAEVLEESKPLLVQLEDGADVEDAVQQAQEDPAIAYAQPNFCYYVMEDKVRSPELSSGQGLAPAAIAAGELADDTETDADQKAGYIPNDPAFASDTTVSRYMELKDDSEYANAWHLYNMNAPEAWEIGRELQSQTVTVAVLDTGCNVDQEDIADAVWQEYAWNSYTNKKMTKDSDSQVAHGTHVCGLAAATANNAMGTAGSGLNAKVLPIGVFNNDASGASTQTIIDAYEYALQVNTQDPAVNLHVINMSLGAYNSLSTVDQLLMDQIDAAEAQGIVTVCAGGNGDQYGRPITAHSYPSDYENTVAVTCLSTDGRTPTSWCDYNDSKDICAPGDYVFSTCGMSGNDTYYIMSGTSQASPVTAGAFAFLFSLDPSMSADDAKELLLGSAEAEDFDDRGRTGKYGAGRLDLESAVNRMCGVSISNGLSQVVSGQKMQMTCAPIGSTSHSGISTSTWSVAPTGDGGSASIDASTGVLEAGMPGTVAVTVDAIDGAGRAYSKTSILTILPVELREAPRTSSADSGAVVVSWRPESAAAGYRILRAASPEGPYIEIGRAAAGAESFQDSAAAQLARQWYKVLPFSQVSDTGTGTESSSVMGAGFASTVKVEGADAATLSTQAADYASMLAEMAAVPRTCAVFAPASDAVAMACATSLAAIKDGLVLAAGSAITPQQQALLAQGSISQAYLLGSESQIPAAFESQLSACGVKVAKCFDTTQPTVLCQQIYAEGQGLWGSEIIVCNPSKTVDAATAASYIWAAKAPIALTSATGASLGSTDLVTCSKFKTAVVMGSATSVTSAVDARLARQGVSVYRAGEGSAASVSLADRMVRTGAASYGSVVLADGNNAVAFASASSMAAALGCPALSIQDDARGAAAFTKLATLKGTVSRVVLCGDPAYAATMARDAGNAIHGSIPAYAQTSSASGQSKPAVQTVIKVTPSVTLAKTSATWTGKAIKPAVKAVKVAGKTVPKANYIVTYKNNRAVGKATVTVTLKAPYSGSKSVAFKITPKASSVSKLVRSSKALTVKWKKLTGTSAKQATGYQVRYSTSKSMKGAKTKTIKGASKASTKITKLKAAKRYYVQVRTYKAVGKTLYASAWSKAKAATTGR